MMKFKNYFKKREINNETQELLKEKNTVVKKQEEAFNFLKDKSFKFIINSISDINILCHKKN